MLSYLIVQANKPIKQEVAESAMVRGVPLDNGLFFADAPKNYDGLNAVIDPKESDCETIAQGARYNKIPTVIGERYATTELTLGSLTAGDPLEVSGGKFVEASASSAYMFKYVGPYSNPYGLTMYIVERVAEAVVT